MIKHLINPFGLLGGFLLLCFPIFFAENFSFHSLTIYFYPIFALAGLFVCIYFVCKIFRTKFKYVLILLLFSEIVLYGCIILIQNRVMLPPFLNIQFQEIYKSKFVNSIQYDLNLANYDKELFYKLNPGKHTFKNIEFQNNLFVNNIGVRDDESSLSFPEIVCIGDSYTMGWGVEKEECFESIIEKETGKKTLNLGISSYGTAREYLLLKSAELDSCKLLILQFCDNDIAENRAFVKNDYSLKISPLESYQSAQRTNQLRSSYFPFKWTFEFISKIIRSITGHTNWEFRNNQPQVIDDSQWINDFAKIIELIQTDYHGKILIFHLENYSPVDLFFPKIKSYFHKNPNEKVFLLDANAILDKSDYFQLDPHIHQTGHLKIATEIINRIGQDQLLK